jgi:hypothetical protein
MTKEVILKKYKVNSLDEVPDKEILELALNGSLGERMRVSATMSWCFKTEKDLVDNIRKAINNNKELYVSFEWGEEKTEDKVIVGFI